MYTPPFYAGDREAGLALMRAHPFALLLTPGPQGLLATHLPLLIQEDPLVLKGHLARANPHWRFLEDADSLVVFSGPHAYVSPAWYQTHPSVPTWNYAAVHAHGRARMGADAVAKARPAPELTGRHPDYVGALIDAYAPSWHDPNG